MSLRYGFCLGPEDTGYDSQAFSEAVHALAGDGVCDHGSGFALSLDGGFRVRLGTGFVLVNGRWLENDEPYPLTLPPSSNHADRYDAIAARADYAAKTVTLQVLVSVDLDALRRDMSPLRSDAGYCVLLYAVRVRRGGAAITAADVTDLRTDAAFCGRVVPARAIAGDVLRVYAFLTSGIDREVERILGLAEAVLQKGSAGVRALEEAIRRKTGNDIGDMLVSLRRPAPEREWLLCEGGPVPAGYPALSAMLGGVLPDIRHADPRFHSFLYGGAPGGEDDDGGETPDGGEAALVGSAVVGTAIVGKDVT